MSFFLFKQKTAYEMRISDWSSDVCSSDLVAVERPAALGRQPVPGHRLAFDEGAAQRDVAVVLEPAQLRAEVAVGQRQLLLQPREADLAVAGQPHAHRQADAVLEHRVDTVEDVHRYAAATGCRRLALPVHTRASAIMTPATVPRLGGARRPRTTYAASNSNPTHSSGRSRWTPASA